MNTELTHKVALVCGASQGIGKATAIELAQLGATVIALARSEDKLASLMNELSCTKQQQHDYIAVDIANHTALQQAITDKLQSYGAIDIFIANSGGPALGLTSEASPQQFRLALDQHVIANQLIMQQLLPGMKQQRYGRIVAITSTSVKAPLPQLGVSTTIRWAVAAWAKMLATELAPHGITVNNVLPGYIETDRLHSLMKSTSEQQNIALQQAKEQLAQSVPANRIGQPEEIAQVIAFLATPAASYLNGVALAVDGGRTTCL